MFPAGGWVPTSRGGTAPWRRSSRGRRAARYLGLGLAGLFVLCLLTFVAGPTQGAVGDGVYQSGNDTQAPTFVGGESVNETAIRMHFADDTDVAEASIDVSDFQVEKTSVTNVTVAENGSNATAILHLSSVVDKNELVVSVAPSSDIADESGNVLDADSEFVGTTVTGMDGVPPGVTSFAVEPTRGGNLDITFSTNEPLGTMTVSVGGPVDRHLTGDDFVDPKDLAVYSTTVSLSVDGNYTVRIDNVTDQHGNNRTVGRNERVYVDATPPNAVAGIDFQASEGREFAFDASESRDANGIARLTWVFPGGTNVTGERVTHRFAPGTHTVRLVAVDTAGNVDSDEIVLDLGDGNGTNATAVGNATVAVRQTGTNATGSAIVDVTDARAGQPVTIGAVEGVGSPLSRGDGFAVEGLTLELSSNATYGLAVAAESFGAVADVEEATDVTAVGGLTVVHGLAEESIANVSFTVGVDAATLNGTGQPGDVALYRFHDGEWSKLPTERLNESGAGYRYRATSPGLSRFAIGVGGSPDSGDASSGIVVTGASLNTSDIEAGDAISVEATVVNRGESTKSADLGLSLGDGAVDTQTVELAAGANRTVSFSHTVPGAGEYPVSVDGTVAGSLTVANSSVQGAETGGSLFGFLGFLPLGLLKTVGTFVVVPLLVVWGILKALAIYLGY
ncbi:PKD domain-containing protein [Halobacteriales archaeon Cl-PHB]